MTMQLWTNDALITAAGGTLDGEIAAAIGGFSIDTRSLNPGDVFVALKDVRDGHDFVTAAFAAGAAAALVTGDYVRQTNDGALIRVDDPLRALGRIGMAARARLSPAARVIAVTGSVGKTTTKELLRAALHAEFAARPDDAAIHAASKSFNNHWGVPLTLARMPQATRYGVFEIGMNHAGEITPLTAMVRPNVAIITTVTAAHLGNFASEQDIAAAKAEIFQGLEPGGIAVLPRDNAHFELLARCFTASAVRGGRMVTFGAHADADYRLLDETVVLNAAGSEAAFTDPVRMRRNLKVFLAGKHNLLNRLSVQAAIEAVGAPPRPAIFAGAGLPKDVMAGRGRVEVLLITTVDPPGYFHLIDQSYNANPASMRAELEVLGLWRDQGRARLVAVLGDMLELGVGAEALHVELAETIIEAQIDCVLACGSHMAKLMDALPPARRGAWAADSAALRQALLDTVRPGDVVMIKGSLGSRMAPLVQALKDHFPGGPSHAV